MSPDCSRAGFPRGCPGARPEAERSGLVARRAFLAWAARLAATDLIAGISTRGYGAATRTVDVVIRGAKVIGTNSVRVAKGDTIVLRWTSDERLELHLHGYDVQTTVSPGTPAEMRVRTHASGRFPVEIHRQGASGSGHGERHSALFYLEVYPD